MPPCLFINSMTYPAKKSILHLVLALVICALLGLNAYARIKAGMVAMGVQQAEMAANVASM